MFVVPEQIVVAPVIALGADGAELTTVTTLVEEVLVPQEFVAVTDTFPLVALAVVEIEFVVDVPVQPEGKVQL